MIPQDFIDDLLAQTDIVDVIEPYVPLKKSGANYMACCPFHKEKSPSFSVSPAKQFYHCFGCGAHGSAIGFVMQYQNLGFTEAVQQLADRIGLAVPRTKGSLNEPPEARAARKKQQQTLETALQTAAAFYTRQLQTSPQAQAYAQKRGLSPEIAERYGIGYAPEGWQPLSQEFQPYPAPALIESGLVVENEGRHYDRFRNRLMFPIRNISGSVIGFGGRVLDDTKPKYLNSPDTPLFDKGKNLYGLWEAREAVRDAGRILVVEGYMDAVALAQYGIGYAVAALGTATTAEHIGILFRQTDNVYFCFDGDAAGRKAAWRALENALPRLKDGKNLHFLFLPAEHDPDSFVREHGSARFEEALLHESRPLSQYFWDALASGLDLDTQEGKAELIQRATPLLAQITAPAFAFLLKQKLSGLVGIDPANLAHLMGQAAPKRHIEAKRYTLPRESFRQPETPTLAQRQIRTLLLNPQWAQYAVIPDYLPAEGDAACLLALADACRANSRLTPAQAIEHFRNSPFAATIDRIFRNSLHSEDETDDSDAKCREFQDGIRKLTAELKTAQIQRLREKLKQPENSREDTVRLQKLIAKLMSAR